MSISSTAVLMDMANFRSEALSSLMNRASTGAVDDGTGGFAQILGAKTSAGRNNALRDPEAAYDMMTLINKSEATIKAQYSELSQMGKAVAHMEEIGDQLGAAVDSGTRNADIKARMQDFVAQYNAWVDSIVPDIQPGGVLANNQAAEVSVYELEQSIKNIFLGASDGISGMDDLGLDIDPVSKRASLNGAKLDAMLAGNKNGVVNTIDAFSANFARSAELLNSAGNFIPNQLDNRSRAIQFIADNRSSLQAEFGTGDSAQPTGAVAKALAAYEQAAHLA